MLSPVTLYCRLPMSVDIVVLNCQKCKQCLNGLKSLGLLMVMVMVMVVVMVMVMVMVIARSGAR